MNSRHAGKKKNTSNVLHLLSLLPNISGFHSLLLTLSIWWEIWLLTIPRFSVNWLPPPEKGGNKSVFKVSVEM